MHTANLTDFIYIVQSSGVSASQVYSYLSMKCLGVKYTPKINS